MKNKGFRIILDEWCAYDAFANEQTPAIGKQSAEISEFRRKEYGLPLDNQSTEDVHSQKLITFVKSNT